MRHRELTCIVCPKGCDMTVTIEDTEEIKVIGNKCPRGAVYARNEVIDPRRTVTSTVRVNDGRILSVKTKQEIPKNQIMDCVLALKDVVVATPVYIGDVILENVADTGIAIVATKDIL